MEGNPKKRTILDEIDEFRLLESGWDSYDAEPIDDAARGRAKEFVVLLEHELGPRFVRPVVGPTADGGLALIWRLYGGRLNIQAFFAPAREDEFLVIRDREHVQAGVLKGTEVLSQFIAA